MVLLRHIWVELGILLCSLDIFTVLLGLQVSHTCRVLDLGVPRLLVRTGFGEGQEVVLVLAP